MAIQKIEHAINIKKKAYVSQNNKQETNENSRIQNTIQSTPIDSELLQKYYVSFGSKSSIEKSKKKILEENYTEDAQKLVERATSIAKEYGHPEVNELHIEKAALESLSNYINDLDEGIKTFDLSSPYQIPEFFATETTPNIIKKKEERAKIKPVIKEEIKNLDKRLQNMSLTASKTLPWRKVNPTMSMELVNGIFDMIPELQREPISIGDSTFLYSILDKNRNQVENKFTKFLMKFSEAVMSDKRKPEEKIHLSIYDEKAKNILKNLSLGTNMFITKDEKADPTYLVDGIVHVLKNKELDLGNMNKKNTEITIFNDNVKEEFLLHKVRELSKDKKTNHIMILNEDKMLVNSAKLLEMEDGSTKVSACLSPEFMDLMENQPKNIKFVFIEDKNNYYKNMSNPILQKIFENFGDVSVPVLSTEQAKMAFKEQPLLMNKIDTPFSQKAIDKVVEASALLEGAYPEKAQKVMKKVASYYVGEKEITEKHVKSYMEEAKDLFRVTGDGSSVEVVFDTGKKLNDILGKDATKKEAESIVKQIKKGALGTKGAIIYSQDGSVGSGRKFTAKAIAGEVKAPYIEINALDFGTEEVDLFGGGVASPENSIKKLFSLIKAQAEANPNKSAVLFVENFEYFSVGEMVSEYHQKAMSQLLREMDNADKKGLNILVFGSVRDSNLIGESTLKSFKFIDKIEVESPAGNINARQEILTNFIKKENLKIAGATPEEKRGIIKLMAETTEGFPFVYLGNLVNKIKTVAFERGHKQVNNGDVIEAYLQLTTGRPASGPISEHRKNIVTSHECGHGLNEEYMWRVAEKQNIPWHLGGKVNFITLDPRGVFGGAMYSKEGGNEEYSFEKIFSDLVCDFGGHSAEKHFYNIDGSWGITVDMEMATSSAERSVGIMGQGHGFGKKSLAGMYFKPSEKSLEVLEHDRDVMLDNARLVSDLITKVGSNFNKEFTEKYAKFVGTGECLVHGDTFREEIANWISRQSKEKLAEMEEVDKTILNIIESTKNGIKFDINGEAVPNTIKDLYKSVVHYIKK